MPLPSLIQVQLDSFERFRNEGLAELFDEISPIESFNGKLRLYLPGNSNEAKEFGLDYWFEKPSYSESLCLERDMSYGSALYMRVALVNHEAGEEVMLSDIFLGDFPLMTEKGTFIINGTERVVVSQLIRSPGVYADAQEDRTTGLRLSSARLIPDRGAWMEFETRKKDYLTLKFNRKRTVPVTLLLRALAAVDDALPKKKSPVKKGSDQELLKLFSDVDNDPDRPFIQNSINEEPVWELKKGQTIAEAALIEFYKRMRPGDPPTLDNAREFLYGQLFDQRRYDLERVGRYKLNQRLQLDGLVPMEVRTITKVDIVKLIARMIAINNNQANPDDIDHLGNRRIKTVGELIQNKMRVGLRRTERVVKERMSIRDSDNLTPVALVNIRPVVASIREFFGSSQLSQFMEQTNPLAELTHKRTLSALGPGGLRRERAGFDVRDVHHSHYGRICPIETPEGPNIGLIGRLACYGRVNQYGFIETPYRKVVATMALDNPGIIGRRIGEDVEDEQGMLLAEEGDLISGALVERLKNTCIDRKEVRAGIEGEVRVTSSSILIDNWIEYSKNVTGYKVLKSTGDKVEAGDSLAVPLNGQDTRLYLLGNSKDGQVRSSTRLIFIFYQATGNCEGSPFKFYHHREYGYVWCDAVSDSSNHDDKGLFKKTPGVSTDPNRREPDIWELTKKGHEAFDKLSFEADYPKVAKGIHDAISAFGMLEQRELEQESRKAVEGTRKGETLRSPGQPVRARKESEILSVESEVLCWRELQNEESHSRKDLRNVKVESGDRVNRRDVLGEKLLFLDSVPVIPFVTDEIAYLSADEEDRYVIAQANAPLDDRYQFVNQRITGRQNQQFAVFPARRVEYMDVAPRQIVGISAALIPFLEHDDANRALMGSNMQRQAVPLLQPDVPLVSTGMEGEAVSHSGQVMVIDYDGEVLGVQGDLITIRSDEGELREHRLRKYNRSNQSTCIDQRPVVFKGQRVTSGMIIADSSSTDHGNLALGHDVLAAFLSWDGGNYEDALLVSEDLLRRDKFTSIHIEKHELEARDTKLGAEEITFDIPNVAEDALKDLDEEGIVRIGADVGPNDILVGKITPKGEKELSPEEKLLRAIFGEKAREVKDSSLRLPHGVSGKVVDIKTFTREEHRDLPAGVEKMVRVSVAQKRKLTVGDKMAGRHGNKGVISRVLSIEDMPYLQDGRPVEIILNPLGVPGRMNIGQVLEIHLGWAAERLGFRALTPVFDGAREEEIQVELGRAWLIDHAWQIITERALVWVKARFDAEDLQDDDEIRRIYIAEWLGANDSLDQELLLTDPFYARRVVLEEWLRERDVNPDDVLMFSTDGLTVRERERRDSNALELVLRLWMEWAEPDIELPQDADSAALLKLADQVMFRSGQPLPLYGKQTLYDGRSGEPFDRAVTVGMMNMLKLAHLVEDKVHARSTGPYSLVTQQPLGGKAQFGGQRFGEMEVWALEAYGAAYTLQEMLTVKSDDVQGRVKTYEAIVKGEPIEEPGIPTSFRVLVKELQSLGLSVQAIDIHGEPINFGKEDEKARQPRMSSLFSMAGDLRRN